MQMVCDDFATLVATNETRAAGDAKNELNDHFNQMQSMTQ